jgi:F-type H+-transporting ATPase subunit delta
MNSRYMVLAKKYAQAFLNLYIQSLSYDDYTTFKTAAEALKNNHSFFSLLNIPTLSLKQKTDALFAVLESLHISSSLNPLIKLIIKHQRIFLIPELFEALVQIYEQRKKIIPFTIMCSHTLQPQSLETLKKFLSKKTDAHITYNFVVNKKLIAGIRMRSDLFLWEYSVAKQLRTIRKCIRE